MSYVPLASSFGEEKDLASTFDAVLYPLQDITSFKALYDAFKKEYPKASHYPYAYRLGGITKSSDDGEPGGSAGRPLLSLLEEKDIEGAIIVARYFGGSKLGIPRLRRAFLASAEAAISSARLGQVVTRYCYDIGISYADYETIKKAAKRLSFEIQDVEFEINVRAKIYSSGRLDEFGEKVGLYDLILPEPTIVPYIQEVPHHDSSE